MNPFLPQLERRGRVVLDGGFATALEARGHDLSSKLWSARVLVEQPDEVAAVHEAYLRAGATCVITASYQATLPGLVDYGLERDEAEAAIRSSVEIAREVRDRFAGGPGGPTDEVEPPPLVAASVGPYGAFLADGSEYDGRYGVSDDDLRDFHEQRLRLLVAGGPDVLAFETIPSAREAAVLLDLLESDRDARGWFSFSCADGRRIWDGTSIEAVTRLCRDRDRVAGVGVNCTDPRFLGELVRRIRSETDLPIVAYPNSGERYDGRSKQWSWPTDDEEAVSWIEGLRDAWQEGARVVGGCCRIGPEDIAELRLRLDREDWPS
ncbi:MAG: hypothetical protein AMS19_15035 [Gemmatimonas sp. SG8_23]|nr:MAG: hypothetical protein AMS19_15035 [Gemmatimonas sp. SG8_23]